MKPYSRTKTGTRLCECPTRSKLTFLSNVATQNRSRSAKRRRKGLRTIETGCFPYNDALSALSNILPTNSQRSELSPKGNPSPSSKTHRAAIRVLVSSLLSHYICSSLLSLFGTPSHHLFLSLQRQKYPSLPVLIMIHLQPPHHRRLPLYFACPSCPRPPAPNVHTK